MFFTISDTGSSSKRLPQTLPAQRAAASAAVTVSAATAPQ